MKCTQKKEDEKENLGKTEGRNDEHGRRKIKKEIIEGRKNVRRIMRRTKRKVSKDR